MKIINAGDPNHKHLLKIDKLENGDELGKCSCGREILYPNVYWDRTQHQYKVGSNVPQTSLENTHFGRLMI